MSVTIDMILQWIAQYGFPTVIAVLLLKILADKIDALTKAIYSLSNDLKDQVIRLGDVINDNTKVLYELKGILERGKKNEGK